MILIDENGDLVVKVTEWSTDVESGERSISGVEEFRVRRRTIANAAPSWRKMLTGNNWAEAAQDTVEFRDDPIRGMEILFRVLHNAVTDDTYEATITEVWLLVAILKKWDFRKIEFLKPWFAQWYSKQNFDKDNLDELEQRQLLFPCWRFDHPAGFAMATRFLAYEVFRHIKEDNPSEFTDLHLPHRLIDNLPEASFAFGNPDKLTQSTAQLNAAKGRLRTVIHRMLYEPVKHLLTANCKCKAETLWGYEKALYDTGAWPLEEVEKRTSMHKVIGLLANFKYKVAENACMQPCHQNYDHIVANAIKRTQHYFDGLCLDCMDRKKPKTEDHDEDYWRHNDFRNEDGWFHGCRIKHKQPSWYFSFMGRREVKDQLQARDTHNDDSE